MRPYIKHIDAFLDRILAGQKVTISTTTILLMAIVILLTCFLLENNEKPKNVRVVNKKPTTTEGEKKDN